ncbi:MAG: mRNA interferase MazF [Brevundimonas sp.]|jgi:mRNA interferase MazF|uniref:type II toxin-antitoxin system PemK/MazF family toxin n=1 Tax=Brevundimonas sp. TaxID=1871086 RepID=UPI0039E4DF59
MPTYRAGDIVRVPFPYTDRDVRQYRPALIISNGPMGDGERFLWALMITSAEHRRWPGDIDMDGRHQEAGLPSPSLVRTAKIATVETNKVSPIGRLPGDLLVAVRTEMEKALRASAP